MSVVRLAAMSINLFPKPFLCVLQRCRYALQFDQQIQEIAALYDVDWIRLWSLNAGTQTLNSKPFDVDIYDVSLPPFFLS
jgi:hypothetical protein